MASALILEDDCLPGFFPFCEDLLERYAQDREIVMIGADAVPVVSSERKNRERGGESLHSGRILRGNYSLATFILELRLPLPIWLVRRVLRWLGR